MSRTFRRKSVPQKKMYIVPENKDWRERYTYIETYPEYVKRAKAEYRADSNRLMFGFRYNVPHWCRNMYQERPFRRRVKEQMFVAQKYDTWDDLSVKPEPRDTWIYY